MVNTIDGCTNLSVKKEDGPDNQLGMSFDKNKDNNINNSQKKARTSVRSEPKDDLAKRLVADDDDDDQRPAKRRNTASYHVPVPSINSNTHTRSELSVKDSTELPANSTVGSDTLNSIERTAGADEAASPSISPFFRLPRELRDMVYDLAAKDNLAPRHLVVMELQKGEKPKVKVTSTGGLAHASSQLRTEYQEMVLEWQRYMMKQPPVPFHLNFVQADKWITKATGGGVSNVVAHIPAYRNCTLIGWPLTVVIQFAGLKTVTGSQQRMRFDPPESLLSNEEKSQESKVETKKEWIAARDEMIAAAKGVDWRGSIYHYMLWFEVVKKNRAAFRH